MVALNISSSQASNYSGLTAYSIPALNIDGITQQNETYWQNTKFSTYWGYFNAVPELKNAILLKSIWNLGKGWIADPETTIIFDHIKGWGKDTFDDILFNMEVMRRINGDSFAEIIKANNGTLINLKPLDPSSIRIVVDDKGIIIRYEQISKLNNKKAIQKFNPEEIFHLSNNRLADQIHGISDISAVEDVILADSESFADMKKVMHFQAKPFIVFKLKTDNQTKIAAFAEKIRNARNLGEDMFIPDDENLLSYDVVQVNPSQILMLWRDDMRNKFYRTIGLPQIIPGGSGQSSISESKTIYLAFEQLVKSDQRYLENQIWQQLNFRIKLISPTTITDVIGAGMQKDGANAFNVQQGEINPGVQG